jgi:hypothetical protein
VEAEMSKKVIGVGASAVLAMVLLIEQSAAACFETAEKFKLEGGDKAKNIQTIMDYGNCIKNEYAEKRAGKYVCHVANRVGIREDNDNKVTSGNMKPSNEKFFVTIEEINQEEKRRACEWGEFGLSNNLSAGRTNSCLANFKFEFMDLGDEYSNLPNEWESIDGTQIVGDLMNFTMFGTGEFVLFSTNSDSSYVQRGKCEKVK